VFESIKRECFPFPRGWVMGHCSVGSAGRDKNDLFRITEFDHNATLQPLRLTVAKQEGIIEY
jgi:hypothetical protein